MIQIDVSALPTIRDKNSWETFVDHVGQGVETTHSRCASIWRRYSSWIIFFSALFVLLVVVICVIVFSSKTNTYPCMKYDVNMKASDVSVECLQYTWNLLCQTTHPYTFPQGYTGWWRSSPQGSTMVPCGLSPGNCGVGSYGNIIIYMQLCNFRINQ